MSKARLGHRASPQACLIAAMIALPAPPLEDGAEGNSIGLMPKVTVGEVGSLVTLDNPYA